MFLLVRMGSIDGKRVTPNCDHEPGGGSSARAASGATLYGLWEGAFSKYWTRIETMNPDARRA